jgi:hypothetical protein
MVLGPYPHSDDGPDGRPRLPPWDPASHAAQRRARVAGLEPIYWRNRDEILASVNVGTRPWAWYAFEAPPHPSCGRKHASSAASLACMGVLTDREIARLRADARDAGGPYRAEWEEVAEVLGLDPGPRSSSADDLAPEPTEP